MNFSPLFYFWLLAFCCFAFLANGATLVEDEVEVMKEIAKKVGKNDWNFSVDPCSGLENWNSSNAVKGMLINAVTCDCSFANANVTVCHVVSIVLKYQNLTGTLPSELVKLPYLQEIDLTRNYLNGTIPPQWGSMKLVNISLLGNRLTGSIPKELGNITTLKSLVLEFNQLTGELPPELGNLSQLERLHLTSNHFTGNLPATFAKLTKLNHVRLGDNQFSGTIPNFIQSWTTLQRLVVQGSGMSGPIPSGISLLKNLTDLRIADLKGPGSYFPPLSNLTNLETLVLRSCNLIGTVPDYLENVTTLKSLDLSFNKLSGTIPSSFSRLLNMNILSLEFNQLSGELPPELGNLLQLERLHVTSNFFTGNLPATFARLSKLNHVRLGDNQFSGAIPNFIQSWTSLQRLVIHGSGMSGPIPSGISLLKNLTDLRISDLKGPDSYFPPLSNLTNLGTLVLRSCNLIGSVPDYLGNVTTLRSLDLSFNKLSGSIPNSLGVLTDMNMLYLTGNFFTGPLPNWIANPDYTDLSYNNFSIEKPDQLTCQQGTVNLFASALKGNNSGTYPCLGITSCPKPSYSLHINCGGKIITYNGNITYDEDSQEAGQAKSLRSGSNWAVSNTGHFFDSGVVDYYTWSNTSKLAMNNAELYMNARVSALSLTYYGYCMGNGSYTVNLHFAEIMFTDDQTYSSLGRRVFDIYIQRKLVLKDFDIAKEAGGVGKAIIKNFTANVTSGTLEIRLQWAGKGTTAIPFGSVYGPLISAISVNPDFTPPLEKESNNKGSGIPVGAILGIVFAGALVIIMVFGIAWWRGCLGQNSSLHRDLQGLDLKTGIFTLRQIKAATNNFDIACKIGEGGFGPVYKGILPDGTAIAVKQLSSRSKQGNREFTNEIGMISALQHPCLVKLYGCCMEGDQMLLIYEYMENNSLASALW
ncbi:hypothetical protein HN873_063367, partial [Arachis hypogaea]